MGTLNSSDEIENWASLNVHISALSGDTQFFQRERANEFYLTALGHWTQLANLVSISSSAATP